MTRPFPHGFDPSTSVLFLGAGFSRAARNIGNSHPPTLNGLTEAIRGLAELPPDDSSLITDLSGYAVQTGHDLFALLKSLYTISEITDEQKKIINNPWLRIYTTNYDDSVELYWSSQPREANRKSYSIEDAVPTQISRTSIIHIHGFIGKCNRDNVLDQLVLSQRSYVQQLVTVSPWWSVFDRDIRVAEHLFFVGYELNDFTPAVYLSKHPALKAKTHFILLPDASPVATSRLDPYGTRHDFGVSGFAKECQQAVVQPAPAHANALSTFRYLDPLKDNKAPAQPTPIEIQSAIEFGSIDINRLISTFPNSTYIYVRADKIDQIISDIADFRTIILHSKIGNGKTYFKHQLALALTKEGYKFFELRENITPSKVDIDFIRGTGKAVVSFPNYDSAYTNIHLFDQFSGDFRFLVEVNTSTLQVRRVEATDRLPKPLFRVDLNWLSPDDCRLVFSLLDKAGIAPKDFLSRFQDGGEFRDIVLSIFENPAVIARIDRLVKPLLSNADAKLVILCSAILKALGLASDPTFLRSMARVDVYDALSSAGEIVYEFVDYSLDSIEPHSAVFSEFLIKRYLAAHELAGAIFRMATVAAKRMDEETDPQSERARTARATLGALLRYSFLDEILRGHPNREGHITDIYENGRANEYIQGEPLFWLQYSIFMQACGRWDLAEKHMNTAYKRGEARLGFRTYQLDTFSLGLFLQLESMERSDAPVSRVAKIFELLDRSRSMIADGNHRAHALKVLLSVEPFVIKRKLGLGQAELIGLKAHLDTIILYLNSIPLEERVTWGSEPVRLSLSRARAFLG